MTRIVRIGPDTIGLLDRIAPDVFDAPIDPELIGAMFAAGNHHLFVALDADLVVGQCLGMVLHGPDRPAALYIDNLGVTGTHRRQGIGSGLLKAIFAAGKEAGCTWAWLGSDPDSDTALPFYHALGLPFQTIQYTEFDLS